jgi:tRNA U34 5-carboxymethylaminomethyl modifying enzyme MnmG/GidA
MNNNVSNVCNNDSMSKIKSRKIELLVKLNEFKMKGIILTDDYSLDESTIEELQYEYEYQSYIKSENCMIRRISNVFNILMKKQ